MIGVDSWLDDTTEAYVSEVIDCGFVVHCDLGPGYMESPYRNAMCIEMSARSIPFECERTFTVKYRGQAVGIHRVDLVIRDCIIVELKAAKTVEPVHRAQLMAYMKASKIRVGLLMNFGCATFKEGIQRIVM
jgi:GxxExxY protein